MTTTLRPSPATAQFIEDIRAMRRGELNVGDDCAPLVQVLKAYQAEDAQRVAEFVSEKGSPR